MAVTGKMGTSGALHIISGWQKDYGEPSQGFFEGTGVLGWSILLVSEVYRASRPESFDLCILSPGVAQK